MRKQEPKKPDNWLYRDLDNNDRDFTKYIYLGVNDTFWDECTDAEKQEYESKQPEPVPEPNDTEAE